MNTKDEKKMKDVSVVIPFVGEHPQVLFTIQSIAQELLNTGLDFEIIAVDNYCQEVQDQMDVILSNSFSGVLSKMHSGNQDFSCKQTVKKYLPELKDAHKIVPAMYENKSGEAVKAASKINPWLRYMQVTDTLSHWECKQRACDIAQGRSFLFVDAHTIPSKNSLSHMVHQYLFDPANYWERGTFHMPLTYKILEAKRLIYKMKIEGNFYGYSFTTLLDQFGIFEVPCMSTCGMLISRKIYEKIGGWPKGLTMYGGGENFINYTLSVCGFKKWIFPEATLFHHGDKRDYHFTYDGMLYNRLVAHYLFGGKKLLKAYSDEVDGSIPVILDAVNRVLDEHKQHRSIIRCIQKMEIEEWTKKWG